MACLRSFNTPVKVQHEAEASPSHRSNSLASHPGPLHVDRLLDSLGPFAKPSPNGSLPTLERFFTRQAVLLFLARNEDEPPYQE